MEEFYPQALFSTPGMVSVFIIVSVIEVLSLIFLFLVVMGFRKLTARHEKFFAAMNHNEQHARVERISRVIFLVYIVSTILVTLITAFLFIYQPHLL